jgi:hypothetical protein
MLSASLKIRGMPFAIKESNRLIKALSVGGNTPKSEKFIKHRANSFGSGMSPFARSNSTLTLSMIASTPFNTLSRDFFFPKNLGVIFEIIPNMQT